jgi:membrane protein required for beta-lactamase induction
VDFWYILCLIGIFSRFGMLYQEKFGNLGINRFENWIIWLKQQRSMKNITYVPFTHLVVKIVHHEIVAKCKNVKT